MSKEAKLKFLFITFLAVLIWSGIKPHDYFTWILEVGPAMIGVAIVAATYRRFPLSMLSYYLIWIHAAILMVGGHYTYAEVPLFDWIRDALGHHRNSYDGVGHFAQGFIPAILTREILLRKTPLQRGGWLNVIVVSICLAISALYELIEWWVALLTGTAADAFLGAQGDPWDTQKDMCLAWIGAMLALFTLSRIHDRSMQELESSLRPKAGFAASS
jgi:putative membrane protein